MYRPFVLPGQDDVRSPRLEGRRVGLRPLAPHDYDSLYEVLLSAEYGFRWRYRGRTPSPEEFVGGLWDRVLAQFIVTGRLAGEPIGMVTCYNANNIHNYAFVAVVAFPKYRRMGLTLEGLAIFVNYLFTVYPLRKLYAETMEFNHSQFASGDHVFWKEEGRWREHEWYGDRYWDLVTLALYRSDWEAIRGEIERYVLPLDDPGTQGSQAPART